MPAVSVERPTVKELQERRAQMLEESGKTLDKLIQAEQEDTLHIEGYAILEGIRQIDFLLDD